MNGIIFTFAFLLGAIASRIGPRVLMKSIDYLNAQYDFNPFRPQYFGKHYRRFRTKEKVVALTFDDGPDPKHTPEVLKVLREKGVKATFFMIGRKAEEHPELVKEIAEQGHQIGNHSYSHPWMIFKSPGYLREEIVTTEKVFSDIGISTNGYFRSPYGAQFLFLPLVLNKLKMCNILFDVTPLDWLPRTIDRMLKDVNRKVRPGSIILLHDGLRSSGHTAELVSKIIGDLGEKGYKFHRIDDLIANHG